MSVLHDDNACIERLQDTLDRIEAMLPAIEKEPIAGSDPNYRVGFREGREYAIALIRKAMETT